MSRIVDEKFKDASPVETVERIRKILSNNGISVTENWGDHTVCNCYALRLDIDGTTFGSNGKGVTKELARASAHAELMERIQSGILGSNVHVKYADSIMMDRETLKANCDVFFERISGLIKDFDGVDIPADQIMEAAFDYNGGGDQTEVIPFYNLTDDKMIYFPTNLMVPLYSSTGLAAGNSPEEAMVQGMSEIVERWCQRHFLCKDLVPPTIPEDYLKQYPMAYETITQVRNSGYDVIIKDCSMGMGWPTIATVVIDKKTHAYHVHMGASPVFEIALGRSLTETFQGRVITSVADTYLSETPKDALTYRKSYIKGRGAYPIAYFSDEPSFPFVPFEDRTHCSNQELLAYALNFFREKGMKICVRDMSHWGFCTYQVFIPEICITHFGFLTSELNVPRMFGDTKDINIDLKSATPDELFEIHLLNMYRLNNTMIDGVPKCSTLMMLPISQSYKEDCAVAYIHIAYVAWACGYKKLAYEYAELIEKMGIPGISDYFSCLCRAKAMLKEKVSLDIIMRRLAVFYDAADIAEVNKVLENDANPFEPYIVSCGKRDEKCNECRYKDGCYRISNMRIGDLVNEHAAVFDNEKAFANLKALLRPLYEKNL